MDYATPQFTRTQVDRAGRVLVGRITGDQEHSLQVINNWRASHHFPLNTFQLTLRNYATQIDKAALVAQRIKRLSSIEEKLQNEKSMQLSQMQDIGGCRAVLASVGKAYELRDMYQKSSRLKHTLVKENDYISEPKPSGYRSIHRVYRYVSDKKETYNGLQIEVQIRSQLQHAWATAVETVSTFLKQALKASRGSEEWLSFFRLMGSAMALRENTPLVPGTVSSELELVKELREYAANLEVEQTLKAYRATLSQIEMPGVKDSHYFLVELRPKLLKVFSFTKKDLAIATDAYLEVERTLKDDPGAEAVLVSVESLGLLRRAYPNYFLDTDIFLNTMNDVIS